jgi:hypothetical protein
MVMSRSTARHASLNPAFVGGDQPVSPTADPAILALEAWHLLSPRTRHCLERRSDETNPASTIAGVPIEAMHLSNLAQLELKDIARLPNLGRICLCEIALAMQRYGWNFNTSWAMARDIFDHPVFTGLATLLAKVERAAEKRRSTFDQSMAMLEMGRREHLTAKQVGERFGVSAAMAQVAMGHARQMLDQRARFPLPPTH